MKAAIWVQDAFRALPRYLLVLTAVSALALLARTAVPSSSAAPDAAGFPAFASASAASGWLAPLQPSLAQPTPFALAWSASAAPAQIRLPTPLRTDPLLSAHSRLALAERTSSGAASR